MERESRPTVKGKQLQNDAYKHDSTYLCTASDADVFYAYI